MDGQLWVEINAAKLSFCILSYAGISCAALWLITIVESLVLFIYLKLAHTGGRVINFRTKDSLVIFS